MFSCGNVNWARRTNCNVCNAPKINTHGQRTGYGGGYMERDEVVDYKRHEDSDDEFDEVGLLYLLFFLNRSFFTILHFSLVWIEEKEI